MYKIGEFSKINKISQRMLRFYDQKGLLKPIKDEVNGYRYYTHEDIEIITRIKYFRDNKFSIEEIKNILSMNKEEVETQCIKKIEELSAKSNKYFDIVEELKKQIKVKKLNIINSYDITKGKRYETPYIYLREKVNRDGLENTIDKFDKRVKESNLKLKGKYFILFHEIDEEFDIEICQPIEVKTIDSKILKESEYISTIHFGDYYTLNKAYEALFNWTKLNGYKLISGYMEKYYVDEYLTTDRNSFITEVSICIEKA